MIVLVYGIRFCRQSLDLVHVQNVRSKGMAQINNKRKHHGAQALMGVQEKQQRKRKQGQKKINFAKPPSPPFYKRAAGVNRELLTVE